MSKKLPAHEDSAPYASASHDPPEGGSEPGSSWSVAGEDFGPPPPLLPPPPVPDAPGEPSGTHGTSGYQVLRLLGEGGMAQVFHARRLGAAGFTREVALKRVRTRLGRDDSFRRMFVAEALLAARLRHPGIAQVHDLIEEPEGYALVMEYVEGHTLKELMQVAAHKARPLDPAFACHVAIEVAEALHHAHQLRQDGQPLGIVHRDVTPHNLMLSITGEVKLLDFGIAWSRLEERERTGSGVVKGKTSYMSPEQALGEEDIDGRSDQFSLAIVLVEMLTGRRVFDAGTNELKTLHRIILAAPQDVEAATGHLARELRAILHRALSRDREARFPSCAALAQALRDYLASEIRVLGPRLVTVEVARLLSQPDASEDATASLAPVSLPASTATSAPPARAPSRSMAIAFIVLVLGAAGLLGVRLHGGEAPDVPSVHEALEHPPGKPSASRPPAPPDEPGGRSTQEPPVTADVQASTPSSLPPGRHRSAAPLQPGPAPSSRETSSPPRRSLATPMGTSFVDAPGGASSGNTTTLPESP